MKSRDWYEQVIIKIIEPIIFVAIRETRILKKCVESASIKHECSVNLTEELRIIKIPMSNQVDFRRLIGLSLSDKISVNMVEVHLCDKLRPASDVQQ